MPLLFMSASWDWRFFANSFHVVFARFIAIFYRSFVANQDIFSFPNIGEIFDRFKLIRIDASLCD